MDKDTIDAIARMITDRINARFPEMEESKDDTNRMVHVSILVELYDIRNAIQSMR